MIVSGSAYIMIGSVDNGSVESFWSEKKNTLIRIAGTKQGQSEQLFQVSRGYRGVRGVGRWYAPVCSR